MQPAHSRLAASRGNSAESPGLLALRGHACKLASASMAKSSFEPLQRLYGHFSARRRRQLVLLLCLMLVGAVAELVSLGAALPFLSLMSDSGKLSDYPLLSRMLSSFGWGYPPLLTMTILFSAVALVAAAIRVALSSASNNVVYMLAHDLTIDMYRRIIHQPYSFFIARNSSEIVGGFNKIQIITGRVLLAIAGIVTATVIAIAILVTLLLIDAKTASLAGLGFTTIYLAVTFGMRRQLRSNSKVVARAQGQRIQCVQEGVGGIRNVLLDHTQGLYVEKLRQVDAPQRNAEAANNIIAAAPRYLIEAASMVLIAAIAYRLSREPGGVAAALPVLGALAIGAQKLLPLLQQVYQGWASVAGSWAVVEDVLEFLELPASAESTGSAAPTKLAFEESIRLSHVGFQYDGNAPWVLRDLSVTIPKGSRCGIIGRSGGGKSTTVDLIMGLLEPTAGELLIDNRPLTGANRRAWQAHIAHVPQAIYLSDATIAENIALGVEPRLIDRDRVRDAARQAQIADFIESQPDGYDAWVGERGIRLSGGQRQRIAIARALYKQADVLILDEATSALDDATEKAVIDCIDGLAQDLTVLVIAHRLSTVRNCDLVLRLEGGAIVAQGRYDEVVVAERAASA